MRLRNRELEWLWTELAHGVETQQPLPALISTLAADRPRGHLRHALNALAGELTAGKSLPQAVAGLPNYFSPDTATVLEAAGRTGKTADVLRSAADLARRENIFRGGILQALAYPLMLALAASVAMLFLLLAIKPVFMQMFTEMNVEIPLLLSTSILHYLAGALFYAPVLCLIMLYLAPPGALPARVFMDKLRMSVPLLGGVLKRQFLARWCRTFSHALRAGITETEALRLAGRSTGNRAVIQMSERVAHDVQTGRRLSNVMGDERFFPPPLTWMVTAAETRGNHADVWSLAEATFQRQADDMAPMADMVLRIVLAGLAFALLSITYTAFFMPLMRLMSWMGL